MPVDEKTRKILRVGQKVRGYKILSFEPPPDSKPASSGHVTTDKGRFYIGVIGGEYIKPVRAVNPRKKNPSGKAYVIALYIGGRDNGKRLTFYVIENALYR